MNTMEIKIPLAEFCKYTDINYNDDLWELVYYDTEEFSVDILLSHLPPQFGITKEMLQADDNLRERINDCLNGATEHGLLNASHLAQDEGVEIFCNQLETLLNNLPDKYGIVHRAITDVQVNWKSDEIVISINPIDCCKVLLEIINGDGMFHYNDLVELVKGYDGDLKYGRCVEHHLHYLLDTELIKNVFNVTVPEFDWEVKTWEVDKEYFVMSLEESLQEYAHEEGNVDRVVRAINKSLIKL